MCRASEPPNIVLIGFMGAGKTTVGQELARLGGFRLVDLDALIEERAGRSIPEIFARQGEETFRDLESEALRTLAGARRTVVATGGGIVGREENWTMMRRLGKVIYLRVRPQTLRARLGAGEGRPLARRPGGWTETARLLERRIPLYEQADLIVDNEKGGSPREVARLILQKLSEE